MAGEEIERVGDLLIEEGVVTHEDLMRAIVEGGIKGSPLAAALESCKHPKRQEVAALLAADFRIPRLTDLRQVEFQADAAEAVPEEIARKHELVPVARAAGILCVAKPNYYNRAAVQELRRHTGLKVKVLQADEGQVKAAIERIYAGSRAEIPAPKGRTETVRRPAPVEARAAFDAVPLVSGGDERPAAGGVLAAVKVPAAEFQAEERSVFTRLFREWDDLFVNGRPSSPIKVG